MSSFEDPTFSLRQELPSYEVEITPEVHQVALDFLGVTLDRVRSFEQEQREVFVNNGPPFGTAPNQLQCGVALMASPEEREAGFWGGSNFTIHTGIEAERRTETLGVGWSVPGTWEEGRSRLQAYESLGDFDPALDPRTIEVADRLPKHIFGEGHLTIGSKILKVVFKDTDEGTDLTISHILKVEAWPPGHGKMGDTKGDHLDIPLPFELGLLETLRALVKEGEKSNSVWGDSFPTYGFRTSTNYFTFRTTAERKAIEANLTQNMQAILNGEPMLPPVYYHFYDWDSKPLAELDGSEAYRRLGYLLRFHLEPHTSDNPIRDTFESIAPEWAAQSSTWKLHENLDQELQAAVNHSDEIVQQQILIHFEGLAFTSVDPNYYPHVVNTVRSLSNSVYPQIAHHAQQVLERIAA